MNFHQLEKADINKSIYLLKGDAFLCLDAKKILIDRLNISEINVSVFTDENFDTNNIINSCNQFSFFNEKRMVIIQDIFKELSQDNKKRFENYSKNPNKDCLLVIIDSIGSKTLDFIKEVEIIDCKPNQDYIINFIKEQFNKYNKNISLDNCKKLNDYCLGDLNRINLEIKKISDYLISKVEVLDSDIDKLVFKDTELKVFDLTNALGVKDGNKALKILYDMLQANEAPIKILALITGTFRRMMFAKINKGSNAELANALNCKEFAIVKAKESANKYSATQLKNILNLLLEADYNIKSGQMSQENVLYYLICKIVN